jgi:hypothetical protein
VSRRWFWASQVVIFGLSFVAFSSVAGAQGLRTVIESRDRVFPAVGAGVTAMKRDSEGRYYILARPATTISVYSANGNLIGHIPNAASAGAIRYAVDIDLTPNGSVAAADRGASAIEVFRPDGSLVSRIPVFAPTSVVALSDTQFAVTTLTSKRLVEVIDDRGNVLRSFGDPTEIENDPQKETLHDFGTISGDSTGDIYFAFSSLPDPTLRKYDAYGYVAYESSIPKDEFGVAPSQPVDRVQLLFGLSDLSFSHQAGGWVSIGSSKDVRFGGDVGTGIGESLRRGFGLGQALQQQGGFAGGPLAATFSGEVNGQGTKFQLGMGHASGMGGRRGGRMPFAQLGDQSTNQGTVLQFLDANGNSASADISAGLGQESGSSASSGTTAELGMFGAGDSDSSDSSDADLPDSSDGLAAPGANPSMGSLGLPAPFVLGSTLDSLYFRPRGLSDSITGGEPSGQAGGGSRGPRSGARGPGGGTGNFSHFGYHGRFNAGVPAFTAALRINLGNLVRPSDSEKPEITAVAADRQSHEIWAAIGDTVVHFSKDGNPVGIYYLALPGGGSLKPTALLVEPDRLLMATDPWGIFEFARPDKPSPPPGQFNIEPQVVPQPR